MGPTIGITTWTEKKNRGEYSSLAEAYSWSIAAVGGVPVAIPVLQDGIDYRAYLGIVDGILFSGGADMSPLRYGEVPLRQVNSVSSARDGCEMALAAGALESRMPLFGICRGHQVLNVAMGGTLYQDLGAQLPDTGGHAPQTDTVDEPHHIVEVSDPLSIVGRALAGGLSQGRIATNSFHHQAVKDLAAGLRPTAYALDGVLEGFEGVEGSSFILGVQFHPECMTRRFPVFLGLFKAFVDACAAYRALRIREGT
jgi:putative glutamine amidotransferase